MVLVLRFYSFDESRRVAVYYLSLSSVAVCVPGFYEAVKRSTQFAQSLGDLRGLSGGGGHGRFYRRGVRRPVRRVVGLRIEKRRQRIDHLLQAELAAHLRNECAGIKTAGASLAVERGRADQGLDRLAGVVFQDVGEVDNKLARLGGIRFPER